MRAAAKAGQVLPLGAAPGERARVDASLLRTLCLEPGVLDPHGLMVENARVTGLLDLSAVNLPFPLWFTDTIFDEQVQLLYSRLSLLSFDGCTLPRLAAGRLRVDGDLFLDNCTIANGVSLPGGRVGGLSLNGTTVGRVDRTEMALIFDGLEVDEDVGLEDGFVARGDVSFRRARIGGSLSAEGARLEEQGSLTLDDAEIGGDVRLADGFDADGGVVGVGVRIIGSLSLDGAIVRGDDADAIALERASVGGDVHLTDLKATGRVSLDGAKVGRAVFCRGTTIANRDGEALSLRRAEIADLVFLGPEFHAVGEVLVSGARIGGDLNCCDARIEAEGGDALTAIGTDVRGALLLTGLVASGTLYFMTGRVGGVFGATGATVSNPGGDALRLLHVAVDSTMLLNGLVANGSVKIVGARIAGDLNLDGAHFMSADGRSLVVVQSDVAGQVMLSGVSAAGLSLLSTRAGLLADDLATGAAGLGSWSNVGRFQLDGFAYGRLAGAGQRADVGSRIRWLRASYAYEPAAWLQLASVLRASGRDGDATRVLIAMQNDRLRRGGLSPVSWLGRQILRVTIGHGYRPWLAGAWATAVIAAFAVVVWQASERFVAAKDSVHGAPQPVVYAADTFLPIVDFGQAGDWDPTGWTRWAAWAVIAVGWALTTIFVGGFTKLVRST